MGCRGFQGGRMKTVNHRGLGSTHRAFNGNIDKEPFRLLIHSQRLAHQPQKQSRGRRVLYWRSTHRTVLLRSLPHPVFELLVVKMSYDECEQFNDEQGYGDEWQDDQGEQGYEEDWQGGQGEQEYEDDGWDQEEEHSDQEDDGEQETEDERKVDDNRKEEKPGLSGHQHFQCPAYVTAKMEMKFSNMKIDEKK